MKPDEPLVFGIYETLERRWGRKIKARGIYRDAVRSSQSHFVKARGLRWMCLMVVLPLSWAGRVWALPFLTVLAASERYYEQKGKKHKKRTDWAPQMILQIKRWLPDRKLIVTADASYRCYHLLEAVRTCACMITRLRLDARLFIFQLHGQRANEGPTKRRGKNNPRFNKG